QCAQQGGRARPGVVHVTRGERDRSCPWCGHHTALTARVLPSCRTRKGVQPHGPGKRAFVVGVLLDQVGRAGQDRSTGAEGVDLVVGGLLSGRTARTRAPIPRVRAVTGSDWAVVLLL